MKKRCLIPAAVPVALFLFIFAATGPGAGASQVQLYRDTWGVPHVYAETLGDAAFGLGYAQAEDRLPDLFINIRIAIGAMAEAFGAEHVERDFAMRMVKNAERCEAYWQEAPADVRAIGDNFMRGVEAYMAEHPDKVPPFALPLGGWQCLAISRAMVLNWPLEALMAELRNKRNAPPPFASNSFALAPSRTSENAAMIMTDPHLVWEGLAVFYEARLHGGDTDLCGFWLVGSPLPALGHSGHVSWACTTGGPDTSDVFVLKLNPENPLQYEYEGAWHDFEISQISIPVAGADPVERTALYTELGPVLEAPDPASGVVYCGASPYLTADRQLEQSLAMARAENVDAFYQALTMNQLMEQNFTFADRQGNIQYIRIGATPVRAEGPNWKAPVPWSAETRWRGLHDFSELVQIKNPSSGFFVNCNNSPEFMLPDSPMLPDKYPGYIYNITWDYRTPRGARLLQLLSADDSVSVEEAKTYTLDVYDILAEPWQKALRAALDAVGEGALTAEARKAAQTVLAWDGQFTRDSAAGPIIRYWRLRAEKTGLHKSIADGKALQPAEQEQLLQLLNESIAEIADQYGRLDITWGDINLVGRGGRYYPTPGAEFGDSGQMERTETVLDIGTRELAPDSGKFVAYDGSSSIMLSVLHSEGIKSYSLLNWGQSGDPNSPHYLDQAEKLYVEREFKPTWFAKEELLQHVASEKTLNIGDENEE